MKRYKELKIKDNPANLKQIISRLKSKKTPFHYMKTDSENYAKNIFVESGDALCMKTNRFSLYESTVWLVREDNILRVANITSRQRLDLKKYNSIITEFYNSVIEKVLMPDSVASLSDETVTLQDLLTEESYHKFQTWYVPCNKDSLITHPADYGRWLDFIISCHRNEDTVSESDIAQYLIEDEGYEEEEISRLCTLFDFGIDILKRSNE